MPVLAAEPDVFPEALFADGHVPCAGRCWRVMHTRPRQEKSLARQLYAGQVPFYLPLVRRRWRSHNRTMTSFVPLFAGYIFLWAGRDEVRTALTTNRIVQSLEVPDQEGLWHDLRQIKRMIDSGSPVTPEGPLLPGTNVEIQSGPLAGLRGKIISTASGRRCVVQVDFIQRAAAVQLEDFVVLKRIDSL